MGPPNRKQLKTWPQCSNNIIFPVVFYVHCIQKAYKKHTFTVRLQEFNLSASVAHKPKDPHVSIYSVIF